MCEPPRYVVAVQDPSEKRFYGGGFSAAHFSHAVRYPLSKDKFSASRDKLFAAVTATVDYEVRLAREEHELKAALALRHDVFCLEQGVPAHEELDGRDPEGIHLIAVRGDELLGTCRLVLIGSTVQFSRLAVRADARRQGIATALLEQADLLASRARARRIVLHAQTYARRLYELAGYRTRGGLFTEAGIEHVAMEKDL